MPALYATDSVPFANKIIRMHFFTPGCPCDWYAAEYNLKDRIFFGFVLLAERDERGAWGYFSLDELRDFGSDVFQMDRDLFWTPCQACEVDKIARACGWPRSGSNPKRGPPAPGCSGARAEEAGT